MKKKFNSYRSRQLFMGMVMIAMPYIMDNGEGEPVLQSMWQHETMATTIGEPAIIGTDADFPVLEVDVKQAGLLNVTLWCNGSLLAEWQRDLAANETTLFELTGNKGNRGRYTARLVLQSSDGERYHDQLHFTVLDENDIPKDQSLIVHDGPDGTLRYLPDFRGNRIPDFSHAGYRGGGVPLPEVPVRLALEPAEGDDTDRIQQAIDQVSAHTPDEAGIRGAILLRAGVYEIEGSLQIKRSGVVLRGEGPGVSRRGKSPSPPGPLEELRSDLADEPGSILLATGQEQRILIRVEGERPRDTIGEAVSITDNYVPVGARIFHVAEGGKFSVGDHIIVRRYGNADWITEIGMDDIPPRRDGTVSRPWDPFQLELDRIVENVEGDRITVDAPITTSIEQLWGGGEVTRYEERRIEEVGVENLRAISVWEPNENGVDDTRHADRLLFFDQVRNGWVRDVIAEHFFGTSGTISTGYQTKWLTFKNNEILVAANSYYSGPGYSARVFGETGVYTGRYGYRLQGELTLVRDSYTIHSRHAYTVGRQVAGLNVFLDSMNEEAVSSSQPHFRWSVGGLYDNIEDGIAFQNRLFSGSSHGWAGANYVAWNTRGWLINHQPPTAQNWALGHVGEQRPGVFADIIPDLRQGYWESHNTHIEPRSLYARQLEDRLSVTDR